MLASITSHADDKLFFNKLLKSPLVVLLYGHVGAVMFTRSFTLIQCFLRIVFLSFALCSVWQPDLCLGSESNGYWLAPAAKPFTHDSSIETCTNSSTHTTPSTVYGLYRFWSRCHFNTIPMCSLTHHNDDMKHSKTQTIIYYAVSQC